MEIMPVRSVLCGFDQLLRLAEGQSAGIALRARHHLIIALYWVIGFSLPRGLRIVPQQVVGVGLLEHLGDRMELRSRPRKAASFQQPFANSKDQARNHLLSFAGFV